ncbi:hypothetical protein ABIE32_001659 [Comamonas sp. 4034]
MRGEQCSEFQRTRDWLVTLAMTPGWWHYSRAQAAKLEADQDAAGAWSGMREAVREQLKAKGFKPSSEEVKPLD